MASFDENGSHYEDDSSYEWNDHYQIVQCQGCKNISFRNARTNSEDYFQVSQHEFEHAVTEELFPSRLAGRKGIDKELRFLPSDVGVIYNETMRAMANQSPVLAGIGLRALLETVCKEKQASGKDLSKKIDDLEAKSVLTPNNSAVLHRIRTWTTTLHMRLNLTPRASWVSQWMSWKIFFARFIFCQNNSSQSSSSCLIQC